MKQRFPIVLVILSLLVALVAIAAAPMASGVIRLVSVQFVPQKGPVFTFEVSGKFPKSALKGTVFVQGGGNYPLHCTQVDENTVKCNASQRISDVNVSLTWGGSTFWTYVPEASTPLEPVQYCYNIYDYDLKDVWGSIGGHCKDIQAQYGEIINYYNPIWEDNYDYEFMPNGPSCSGINGDAYYYPDGCGEGSTEEN